MDLSRVPAGSLVVAVDGSARADHALEWAAEQALVEHRVLAVVHASGSLGPHGERARGGATADPSRVPLSEQVIDRAVRYTSAVAPGLVVVAVSVPGDPRQVLVDMSEQASAVVLGARGRAVLGDRLLGSVSSYVSAYSACPTVVVRPAPDGDRQGVLVGADGTPSSLPVLAFAFRYADRHRLPLTVRHVAGGATGERHETGAISDADHESARHVEERIAHLRREHPQVRATVELVHGLVVECLGDGQRSWDLVVVGRHPVDSASRRLAGPTATAVLEQARATVAVVPEALSPGGDLLGAGGRRTPTRDHRGSAGYAVE